MNRQRQYSSRRKNKRPCSRKALKPRWRRSTKTGSPCRRHGFLAKDGAIYMTSYAKAQKVVNIQRNPKVGLMIETGRNYGDFRAS